MRPGLPAVVIGGYLGAGKTTLVNHLLRHAQGRRIAVLVNDFGSVNIDADLIEGQHGDVLALTGGCVCCSFGADLVGTLVSVALREPAPDVVLIETSGVALPGMVARSAGLARGIVLDGVVVVADAETLREQTADRYVGDTVMQQLRDADLLLLNKTDLLDGTTLEALHRWLSEQDLRANVIDVAYGQVAPEVVLGVQRIAAHPAPAVARHAHDIFISHTLELPEAVDPKVLAERLARPGQGIVRAKGWVHDSLGQRWQLQVVGARWSVAPAPGNGAAHGPGQLVVIGLKAQLQWPILSLA